ncbi:Pectin acetylesterase 6 [Hordeum vulgare]|nr:Pectin acetylesterase 6 [Hordeum vulgare]
MPPLENVPLTLLVGTQEKGAVCLDRTPPGYHLQRGSGDGSNRWLIHLEVPLPEEAPASVGLARVGAPDCGRAAVVRLRPSPPAAFPHAVAGAVPLTLLVGAQEKGAVCLDGTPPGYHLHRGSDNGSNRCHLQCAGLTSFPTAIAIIPLPPLLPPADCLPSSNHTPRTMGLKSARLEGKPPLPSAHCCLLRSSSFGVVF